MTSPETARAKATRAKTSKSFLYFFHMRAPTSNTTNRTQKVSVVTSMSEQIRLTASRESHLGRIILYKTSRWRDPTPYQERTFHARLSEMIHLDDPIRAFSGGGVLLRSRPPESRSRGPLRIPRARTGWWCGRCGSGGAGGLSRRAGCAR